MNSRKKVYTKIVSLDEATGTFMSRLDEAGVLSPMEGEIVSLDQALDRITSGSVWAKISSPHYHASAMDGYAVRAADTVGASESLPVILTTGTSGQAAYVDTGDPVPDWADAVIVIEGTQPLDDGKIEIRNSVNPGANIRPLGEDMLSSQLVLTANHRLSPFDIGAIAGCGHSIVSVRRKPRIAIIPTGSELITPDTIDKRDPARGEIIEYNSLVLAASVTQWGGTPVRFAPVPDDPEQLKEAALKAAGDNDMVVFIAGSSMGSEDYTDHVLREIGEVLVHGVAVKPGPPVILGTVGKTGSSDSRIVPFVGTPGYPVSCALTSELFVRPLIHHWLGTPESSRQTLKAHITRKMFSNPAMEEFVRVAVGRVGSRIVATPLSRGAGVITSMVKSDGLVRIPLLAEGIAEGEVVEVVLQNHYTDLEKTILHTGSHDLGIDLLTEFLSARGYRLSSTHTGSLGGLSALKRGEAHCAGCSLPDPETGEFNTAIVKNILPDLAYTRIGFVTREVGLLTTPGNPENIRSLEDLLRPDITFINRQEGSGVRMMLDYNLKKQGLDPAGIRGYDKEKQSGNAAAVAVASGSAHCTLGVYASARALELDFFPLFTAEYDLIIPDTAMEDPLTQALLGVIREKNFRTAIETLPGYTADSIGIVRT